MVVTNTGYPNNLHRLSGTVAEVLTAIGQLVHNPIDNVISYEEDSTGATAVAVVWYVTM